MARRHNDARAAILWCVGVHAGGGAAGAVVAFGARRGGALGRLAALYAGRGAAGLELSRRSGGLGLGLFGVVRKKIFTASKGVLFSARLSPGSVRCGPRSSNGRTPAFGAGRLGSNPSRGTGTRLLRQAGFFVFSYQR